MKVCVAPATPTRQGRPYSLATTAPCEMRPPSSVTTPDNIGKYGDHPISVLWVIRMSPGRILSAPEMCVTILTRPVTTPGHAGVPDTDTSELSRDCTFIDSDSFNFFSTWTGFPEIISGKFFLSQAGYNCLLLIAFLKSLLL